jgi:hypothetical protein
MTRLEAEERKLEEMERAVEAQRRVVMAARIEEGYRPTWRESHRGHCHPRCYRHDDRGECLITDGYGAV